MPQWISKDKQIKNLEEALAKANAEIKRMWYSNAKLVEEIKKRDMRIERNYKRPK